MRRRTSKQDPSETNFNEQDAQSSAPSKGDVAGERNHPGSAPGGLSCPARYADCPVVMNNDTRLIAVERGVDDVGREQDVRNWCTRLDCTESEVRDTVRAVMRLMANTDSRRVYH